MRLCASNSARIYSPFARRPRYVVTSHTRSKASMSHQTLAGPFEDLLAPRVSAIRPGPQSTPTAALRPSEPGGHPRSTGRTVRYERSPRHQKNRPERTDGKETRLYRFRCTGEHQAAYKNHKCVQPDGKGVPTSTRQNRVGRALRDGTPSEISSARTHGGELHVQFDRAFGLRHGGDGTANCLVSGRRRETMGCLLWIEQVRCPP